MDRKRNVVLLTAALVFTMSIVICLHNISIQSSVAQPSRYNTSKSQNQTSTIIGGGVTSHAITRIHPMVTERIGTITTVPQFAERNSIAFCHPDEVVVGGGYLIGAGGFPGAAGGQEITASER